jgi:hypothetical protein
MALACHDNNPILRKELPMPAEMANLSELPLLHLTKHKSDLNAVDTFSMMIAPLKAFNSIAGKIANILSFFSTLPASDLKV